MLTPLEIDSVQTNRSAAPIRQATPNKLEIPALIRRMGSPPSIILTDPHYRYFTAPNIEGFVGYRVESHCAVVTGDPVCADKDMPQLTYAFHEFCKANGWNVVYLVVSEKFNRWAMGKVCHASIQFGEEIIVDPRNDPLKGRKGEKLRWKVHKAEKEGVVIDEYHGNDGALEKEIEQAARSWLKARKGPQIYLADVDVFTCRFGKRWFYAKKDNRVVGLMVLNRIDKHSGWVLNMLMTTLDAPVGSSEYLMIQVIEVLRAESCHFFVLGAAPRKSLGKIEGLNVFSALMARGCFKIVNWLFHIHSRHSFWKKFLPTSEPSFLLFSQPKIGLNELRAIKSSVNASVKTP